MGISNRKMIIIISIFCIFGLVVYIFLYGRHSKSSIRYHCEKCGLIKSVEKREFMRITLRNNEHYCRNSIYAWLVKNRGECKEHKWHANAGYSHSGSFMSGIEMGDIGCNGIYGECLTESFGNYAFEFAEKHIDKTRLGEFADFLLIDCHKWYDSLCWRPFNPDERPLYQQQDNVVMKIFEKIPFKDEQKPDILDDWWDLEIRPMIKDTMDKLKQISEKTEAPPL